eukprot:3364176-Amphidinium_carterae.1
METGTRSRIWQMLIPFVSTKELMSRILQNVTSTTTEFAVESERNRFESPKKVALEALSEIINYNVTTSSEPHTLMSCHSWKTFGHRTQNRSSGTIPTII